VIYVRIATSVPPCPVRAWQGLAGLDRRVGVAYIAGSHDLALRDQVVLVTGAGQGLGRAIGLAFAREGARVAFHYHASADGAKAAAGEAKALGIQAIAVGADLRSDAAVTAAVAEVERTLGSDRRADQQRGGHEAPALSRVEARDWQQQIDVTVTGTLRITQAVARGMSARKAGAIVSLMGDSRPRRRVRPARDRDRAGLHGRAHALAGPRAGAGRDPRQLRVDRARADRQYRRARRRCRGRAHAEDPGAVPAAAAGPPDDVIPMVLLLASPLSSWTTGQVISVNGGYAMV
jgi:3-oxoacyl-[acyl-carrier protein] reductase